MINNRIGRSRVSQQRGTVYVTVLGVAMIVSVIGLTSLHISRLELRQTQTLQDTAYARSVAQSSVEYAVAKIESDSSWRSNLVHGTEYSITPTGFNATMSYRLLDNDDNNLADDANEPVEIQGIGRYGDATVVYSITYARSVTSEEQVGPAIIHSYGGPTSTNENVASGAYKGQYFLPSFPAEATSWSVTQIDVYLQQNGVATATLHVNLYSADGSGHPNTLLESASYPEDQLPAGSFDWHQVPISTVNGLTPGVGLCLTLEGSGSGNAASAPIATGISQTNSHMLRGGWGSWNDYPNDAILYRIHGVYTTSSGSGEFTITPGSWQTTAAF